MAWPRHTKVAGVTHEGRQEIIARMSDGEVVELRPVENEHDANAVGVFRESGEQIGWIARERAKEFRDEMERANAFRLRAVASLTGGYQGPVHYSLMTIIWLLVATTGAWKAWGSIQHPGWLAAIGGAALFLASIESAQRQSKRGKNRGVNLLIRAPAKTKDVRMLIAMLIAMVLVGGCAPNASYRRPDPLSDLENSRIVAASFDDAWEALLDHAATTFFAIDRFEKNSGLLMLTFTAEDLRRYIDCGHFETTVTDPVTWERRRFDGNYVEYLWFYKNATLTGRMNIRVRDVDVGDSRAEITVNARYVLQSDAGTWRLDSGQIRSFQVPRPTWGTPSSRICRPTHVAEREILDAVDRLATAQDDGVKSMTTAN